MIEDTPSKPKRKKVAENLTDDQERDLVEWFEENVIFYD